MADVVENEDGSWSITLTREEWPEFTGMLEAVPTDRPLLRKLLSRQAPWDDVEAPPVPNGTEGCPNGE